MQGGGGQEILLHLGDSDADVNCANDGELVEQEVPALGPRYSHQKMEWPLKDSAGECQM